MVGRHAVLVTADGLLNLQVAMAAFAFADGGRIPGSRQTSCALAAPVHSMTTAGNGATIDLDELPATTDEAGNESYKFSEDEALQAAEDAIAGAKELLKRFDPEDEPFKSKWVFRARLGCGVGFSPLSVFGTRPQQHHSG